MCSDVCYVNYGLSVANMHTLLVGADDMDQEHIQSNGNCLFAALAKQLEMIGIIRTEQEVRAELVASIKTNTSQVCLICIFPEFKFKCTRDMCSV